MTNENKTILVLVVSIIIVFGTTMLLDLEWINRFFARQLLVYALMSLEIYVAFKNIWNINNNQK